MNEQLDKGGATIILYKKCVVRRDIDFRLPGLAVRDEQSVHSRDSLSLSLSLLLLQHVVAHIKQLRQLHVEQRGDVVGAGATAAERRGDAGGGVIQPRHRAGRRWCGHAGADAVVVVTAARHRAVPLLQVRRVGLRCLHQRRDVQRAVDVARRRRLHAVADHVLGLVLRGRELMLLHRRRVRVVDQVRRRHLARCSGGNSMLRHADAGDRLLQNPRQKLLLPVLADRGRGRAAGEQGGGEAEEVRVAGERRLQGAERVEVGLRGVVRGGGLEERGEVEARRVGDGVDAHAEQALADVRVPVVLDLVVRPPGQPRRDR
jgi:hypothetical protein